MNFRTGIILAAVYLVPFMLLAGLPPDDIGSIFVWPVYLALSIIALTITAIVAYKFFDIDFIPWGLLMIVLPLPLMLLFQIALIPGLWIVPTIVVFMIGATQG